MAVIRNKQPAVVTGCFNATKMCIFVLQCRHTYTNKPVWNHPETDGQWKDQSAPKKNVHTMCCPTLLFTKYNCTRLVGYFF